MAPRIPHHGQAGKQVMYRSPPLRQERKIVEDTTDDEAHAKDHKVCLERMTHGGSHGTLPCKILLNGGFQGTNTHTHTHTTCML